MRDAIGVFASTTLAGVELAVPDNLTGPTLLVFAYRQRQQGDVDTWLRLVPPDAGVRVLEVPVLGRRWLPGRRFIDGGMAANMDQATREQTMCVYTDVATFRREVLGVTSSEVLATLTDADGGVWWHEFGPATDETADGMQGAMVDLIDRHG